MKAVASIVIFLVLMAVGVLYAVFGLPFTPYNENLLIFFWLAGILCSGISSLFLSGL